MSEKIPVTGIIKSYFQTAVQVIKEPKIFFKDLDKQKGYKSSLKYLAFLWATNSVILFIVSFVLGISQNPNLDWATLIPQALLYFGIGGAVGFVTTLILAVVIHLYMKLFRGEGKLFKTLQLVIYASTPTLLFGWLPIISFLVSIYMIYLLYLGGIELHGLTSRKSLIAFIIIPLVLMIGSALMQSPS